MSNNTIGNAGVVNAEVALYQQQLQQQQLNEYAAAIANEAASVNQQFIQSEAALQNAGTLDDDDDDALDSALTGLSGPSSAQSSPALGLNNSSLGNSVDQMLQVQQLLALFQQISQAEANPTSSTNNTGAVQATNASTSPGTDFAKSFDIKSWGDPHITTTVDGQSTPQANNMQSQNDLVNLGQSIAGGYRVSTVVSQPDANGITLNQAVSVHLDNGAKLTDTFDPSTKTISASLVTGNVTSQLAPGSKISLGNNDTAVVNADGSLTINASNSQTGATVQTAITGNGKGLDVDTSGTNVHFGGYAALEVNTQNFLKNTTV